MTLLFLCSCSNGSSNNQSSQPNKQKSINGIYSYSDSSAESTITVSGNSWFGKLVLKSEFNSNASYSSGIVSDGVLYDDSGYIKLGSVNGTSLSMPIGSNRVTHYKKG